MIIVPDKKKAEEVICLDDSDEDTPLAKMRTPEKDKTRDTKKGMFVIHLNNFHEFLQIFHFQKLFLKFLILDVVMCCPLHFVKI